MRKNKMEKGLIALMLPESQHWSRSILPGLAEQLRSESSLFMVNLASWDQFQLLLESEDPPLGLIGALSELPEAYHRGTPVPFLNISGRALFSTIPTVTHDNRQIGAVVAEHLMERGFRNFAFVGVGPYPLSEERFIGFRDRLAEAGYPVLHMERTELREGQMEDWLHQVPLPLGVFGAHDNCARKVCWEAERLGLSIPGELGVVGVDNDPYYCVLSRSPLSSVALDFEALGREAAKRMLAELQGVQDLPLETRISPLRLVERLSSDLLAVEDPLVRRARDKMKRHREGRLSVGELARQLGVSKSSLEKRFKAATGRTVFSVIHQIRMQRAQELLEHSSLGVAEISQRIGMADSKRFSELFKQSFGVTPRAWRKTHGGRSGEPKAV